MRTPILISSEVSQGSSRCSLRVQYTEEEYEPVVEYAILNDFIPEIFAHKFGSTLNMAGIIVVKNKRSLSS
jgi:hypothetical protein